jgi:hypothetical protein
MKHIYTHDNVLVLHSVKNLLAINGIGSFVKNEHTIPVGARILNDQDYQRALDIIDIEIENPPHKAPWICGQCHEENAGSFQVCWQCQSEHV